MNAGLQQFLHIPGPPTDFRKFMAMLVLCIVCTSSLWGAGRKDSGTISRSIPETALDFATMTPVDTIDLQYAELFSITKYDSCTFITIAGEGNYLLYADVTAVPRNLPADTTLLQQPLDSTYLVSTSQMDLIQKIGALGNITLSGTREKDWYIPEAVSAMKAGDIVYAGKYSAPDYELLAASGCNLALYNTMLYHKPQVRDKLQELGIPVLVERSGYEKHPLGRLEWIKLYGVLFDREAQANEFFNRQLAEIEPVLHQSRTDQTVAFFYVNSNGAVNVRKSNDYVAAMINLAGGTYKPSDLGGEDDNALSTMNMQFEDFYTATVDCDVLIYNGTIDSTMKSLSDLYEKNALFAEYKAVQNGRAYFTGKNFFQETTGCAEFIRDVHTVITGGETDDLIYLKELLPK